MMGWLACSTSQPLEGLTDKKLLSKITIYYQKKIVQHGEVIVGIPKVAILIKNSLQE